MAPPAPLDIAWPSVGELASPQRHSQCVPALLPSALVSRKAVNLPQLLLGRLPGPAAAPEAAGALPTDASHDHVTHEQLQPAPLQCTSSVGGAEEDALITNLSAFACEMGGALLLSPPASPLLQLLLEPATDDDLMLLTPSPSPLCGPLHDCPPSPMACAAGYLDWEQLLRPHTPASSCGDACDSTNANNTNGTHLAASAWPSPGPASEGSSAAAQVPDAPVMVVGAGGASASSATCSSDNNATPGSGGDAAPQQQQQPQQPSVVHLQRMCVVHRPQRLGAGRLWAAPATATQQQQHLAAAATSLAPAGLFAPGGGVVAGKPPLPPAASPAPVVNSSSARLGKRAAPEGVAPSAKRRA